MSLLKVESLEMEVNGTKILRDVSFSIAPGEAIGVVGESGSGKSMTARAIARLEPKGSSLSGSVIFDGTHVLEANEKEMRRIRNGGISMIFQDPRAAINPVRSIGDFLTEGLRTNSGIGKDEATRRAVDMLEQVRVPRAKERLKAYPHQMSGGLLQRTMIAAALLSEPRLLLADEPTTALDVTTQAEIMAILGELREERDLALVFITHDLELAAATTDRIAVMYAGEVVEEQPAQGLRDNPRHPYSAALLAARPTIGLTSGRLPAIPGRALAAGEERPGCRFADRCPFANDMTRQNHPDLAVDEIGSVRCWRADEGLITPPPLEGGSDAR